MMRRWAACHGLKPLVWPSRAVRGFIRTIATGPGRCTWDWRHNSHCYWNPAPNSHCPNNRRVTTKRRAVRIGCASGFWGDTATSVPQLVFGGNLDFLVFDYLSEITMSLLAAAKAKSPNHGYVPDFVQIAMAPFIKDIHKRGIRVVCNAGGVNPHACAAALQEVVKKADLDLKIAVVTGDDLMLMKDLLKEEGIIDMDNGSPFPASVHSINAYLGARPISRALDLGADIVVTGRCIDSGIALGPLIHSVCATYLDGYRATAVCPVGGSRSVEKGRRTAESILKRMRRMFKQMGLDDFKSVNVQILGSEETYGGQAVKRTDNPREAVIWLAVHHMQKKALELFSREIAPAGTGMAPGLTGIVGGRPKVSPVLKPFFFLHPKQNVTIDIFLNGKHVEMFKEDFNYPPLPALEESIEQKQDDLKDLPIGPCSYRLEELAYTRSGDKGNSANIGVIARHPLYYPYLRKAVTAKAVEEYFQHLIQNKDSDRRMVTRYLLKLVPRMVVFQDDILVTGRDTVEHLQNLEEVLQRLDHVGLRLKRSKCVFMATEVEFLGRKIAADDIRPTDAKTEAIRNAPRPQNVTELRSFLGLLNYFGNFQPGLSTLFEPLHMLLRKDLTFRESRD
uniref:uncharacterized protein lratb.1 isoform X5 n=1 Tax=Pristiophorus japonicus TaxID=55135 RepID=UPI00398E6DDA